MAAETADDVLRASLARAHRLLDDTDPRKVLQLLEAEDRRLKRRLGALAKVEPGMRFSDAQLMAYQKQIDVSIQYVKKRLLGITDERALKSIEISVRTTARDLAKLDRMFTGVVAPLRLREAATMADITNTTVRSRLGMSATSVDRYGDYMQQQFRQIMVRGMTSGVSQSQMVDALVGHGGPRGPKVSTAARVDDQGKVIRLKEEAIPEGLFVKKRYWAQRVVRTEVAHGQNEARLQTIERSKQTDFPDMGKKILAMMDMRTAMDSIGVHGQVRPTEGLFMDGAGRQYLRPPARPNDRETIVPWRLSWEETPYSAPLPPAEVARLQQAADPPGKAKQVAIRQAQGSYRAQLDKGSRRAIRAVTRSIGKRLGAGAVAGMRARDVADRLEARTVAKARAKQARKRAKRTLERVEAEAAAQAQRYVTARGSAIAKGVQRVKDARARAVAYQKRQRADAKIPPR